MSILSTASHSLTSLDLLKGSYAPKSIKSEIETSPKLLLIIFIEGFIALNLVSNDITLSFSIRSILLIIMRSARAACLTASGCKSNVFSPFVASTTVITPSRV